MPLSLPLLLLRLRRPPLPQVLLLLRPRLPLRVHAPPHRPWARFGTTT
jgi:hypothetical protein